MKGGNWKRAVILRGGGEGMGNTRELGTGKEPLSFLNICGEMLDVKCVRTKYATKTLLS